MHALSRSVSEEKYFAAFLAMESRSAEADAAQSIAILLCYGHWWKLTPHGCFPRSTAVAVNRARHRMAGVGGIQKMVQWQKPHTSTQPPLRDSAGRFQNPENLRSNAFPTAHIALSMKRLVRVRRKMRASWPRNHCGSALRQSPAASGARPACDERTLDTCAREVPDLGVMIQVHASTGNPQGQERLHPRVCAPTPRRPPFPSPHPFFRLCAATHAGARMTEAATITTPKDDPTCWSCGKRRAERAAG